MFPTAVLPRLEGSTILSLMITSFNYTIGDYGIRHLDSH